MILKGKVAFITGATRGIGRAIAFTLARHGAAVAFSYLNSSRSNADALVGQLEKLGVKAIGYRSNAMEFTETGRLITDITSELGDIDICVNNAGISKDHLLIRLEPDAWNEVIASNLSSVYNITRHVLPYMRKAKKGSIINISSIVGERGNTGQSAYAASKAGVIGFTKSVAREVARYGIRCNAIAPGLIDTDMTRALSNSNIWKEYLGKTPMGRLGSVEDVANATLFLASDQSSFITGQVLSVCGGLNI